MSFPEKKQSKYLKVSADPRDIFLVVIFAVYNQTVHFIDMDGNLSITAIKQLCIDLPDTVPY